MSTARALPLPLPADKTATALPHGLRVRLDPTTISASEGTLLIGGSPLTALRLSPTARTQLRERAVEVVDTISARLADRLLATNLGHPDLSSTASISTEQLTVVIPARDRAAALDRALSALAGLRCIVIDDCSTGPEEIARAAARHSARLIRLPRNVGPAAARNAGLDRVETAYVAFVDSDVQVDSAVLTTLARHFSDPRVVLVGPRVVGHPNTPAPAWFERYDTAASSLTLGRTPGVVRPRAAVGWLPSACLVGRTDVLREQLHGFDPTMRVGEDVDLVWRATAAGLRVRYEPSLEARHETRSTIRGWLGRKIVYGSGAATLSDRHGSAIAPAVLSPAYAAAAAGLLLRRRWAIPVAATGLLFGTRAVRRRLPDTPERAALADRLATRGLGWAVRQESALLLRHWWPATALGIAVSKNVRRAVLSALMVDLTVAAWEHRDRRDQINPAVLLAGRRLDDLAYGAGLWLGCARRLTITPLLPCRPGAPRISTATRRAGRETTPSPEHHQPGSNRRWP